MVISDPALADAGVTLVARQSLACAAITVKSLPVSCAEGSVLTGYAMTWQLAGSVGRLGAVSVHPDWVWTHPGRMDAPHRIATVQFARLLPVTATEVPGGPDEGLTPVTAQVGGNFFTGAMTGALGPVAAG